MTTGRPLASPDERPLDDPGLDDLLLRDELRVLLCVGTGGVGKTTLSAALAVRAAMLGRRVVVVTIDPARRLAQAMGLDGLADDWAAMTNALVSEAETAKAQTAWQALLEYRTGLEVRRLPELEPDGAASERPATLAAALGAL